jgi:hypothetical protein
MIATWGGKESSYFSGCGGFVPLSVVSSLKPLDVVGSSVNGEACSSRPFPVLRLEPQSDMGSSARGGGTEASRYSEPVSPPLLPAACCGTPGVASLSVVGAAGHQVAPRQASLMRLLH